MFFFCIIICSPDIVLVLCNTTRVTAFFGVLRQAREVTHIGNINCIYYRHYAVIIGRT